MPINPDFKELLKGFNDAQVRYLVVCVLKKPGRKKCRAIVAMSLSLYSHAST